MKEELPLQFLTLLYPNPNTYVDDLDYDSNAEALTFKSKKNGLMYFTIKYQPIGSGELVKYEIRIKPNSRFDSAEVVEKLEVDRLCKRFTLWVDWVKEFETAKTIFDDSILKEYQEYFKQKVRI